MAEDFKVIETQEQLNEIIKERVSRAKKAVEEKYTDYDELKTKVNDYENQIGQLQTSLDEATVKINGHKEEVDKLNGRIKDYETQSVKLRIAREAGLPYELASKLAGTNEDELKADAELLMKYVSRSAPPLRQTETPVGNSKVSAYKELAQSLKEN